MDMFDEYDDEDMFVDEATEFDDLKELAKNGYGETNNETADYNNLVGDLLANQTHDPSASSKKRESKPRIKYTEYDLVGTKGLIALKRSFENYTPISESKAPFKDLADIMERIELWAHRLYPSMQFDDFLVRTEQLGKKRPVKTYMLKMRSGMELHDNEEAVFEKPKKENKQDQIVCIE